MFPAIEQRRRVDDYGEAIDTQFFMRGEFQYSLAAAEEDAQRV